MAQPIAHANRMAQNVAKHPDTFTSKLSFSSWFKQFRNYCDLLQIADNNKYRTMLCFLDSDSFDIVEGLQLTANQRADIEDNATFLLIKEALKNQDDIVPAELQLKHRTQKPDESITAYSKALTKLALDAFPNDQNIGANANLIQAFITGVRNDELGIELLRHDAFPTLAQAVTAATEWLGALKTRRFIKTETTFGPELTEKVYNVSTTNNQDNSLIQAATAPAVKINQPPVTAACEQCNLRNSHYIQGSNVQQHEPHMPMGMSMPQAAFMNPSYASCNALMQPAQNLNNFQFPAQAPSRVQRQFPPMQGNQFPQVPQHLNSNYSQNKQRKDITCYFCGKRGHIRSQCYAYKRAQGQAKPTKLFCNYCGIPGHTASNCRHLMGSANAPQNQQASNNTASKNPFRPT